MIGIRCTRLWNYFGICPFIYCLLLGNESGSGKEYNFVGISRIKLLSEPSVRGVVDTKGGPLSICLKILSENKIIIFKKLNPFLIEYFI